MQAQDTQTPAMPKLNPGDSAPAFSLLNQDGKAVSLSDFSGQSIVLYAYPAALTPGCTKQACDFRDSKPAWARNGFELLGISPDATDKLATFAQRDALPFTLLSDPERVTLSAYGAYGEKQLYGKSVVGVIRSTFVIDVDSKGRGKIRHAFYNVKATGHVAKLQRDLGLS